MNPVLERMHDALTFGAGWGWPVLPVIPGDKTPAVEGGFKAATNDADRIIAWWDPRPDLNVGIATGHASGVLVIDLDTGWQDTLASLTKRLGALPETLAVRTPRGGWHAYYRMPQVDVRSSAGKVGPGIDVRANLGYVVAPPSQVGGRPYTWRGEPWPGPPTLSDLPDPWVEALTDRPKVTPRSTTRHASPIPRAVAVRRVGDLLRDVATAPEGQRNTTLSRKAYAMGRFVSEGVVTVADAETWLNEAGRECGLPDVEVARTVRGSLDAGMRGVAA